MNAHQWLELVIYLGALALVTKPLGIYLGRVFDANGKTFLDPVVRPLEKLTYWIFRVDPAKEQGWKQYTFAMLIFSLVSCLFTYAILRLQNYLPLNPQKFGALTPDLSFNTAASFTTNTNWQSYGGESTMSYLSQMAGLAWHNFTSAAAGICVALALGRGFSRRPGREGSKT
ncbi:MAG TPA: potassium-transporting ATPase subunit KdpA, partial [Dongiaceae bacterium]|nr:potassium-transporting ATPase subunit KdpA [Dongiaceae bacterium]